jgi:hypothetical protein
VQWRSIARKAVLCACAIAMALGSPAVVSAAVASTPQSAVVLSAPMQVEADHATPQHHPCKRGAATVPAGSCAVSGYSAGLSPASVEHLSPVLTGARLDLRLRAGPAHQWRGLPPDRPPRG